MREGQIGEMGRNEWSRIRESSGKWREGVGKVKIEEVGEVRGDESGRIIEEKLGDEM